MDEGVGEFHAEAGEDGLNEGAFADDNGGAVAVKAGEEDKSQDGRDGYQSDVHNYFYSAELEVVSFRNDVNGVVCGENPALAYDLKPDSHGGEHNGGKAQQNLDRIICCGGVQCIKQPYGAVNHISEKENGYHLQHVFPFEVLTQQYCLNKDEQQVECPGESADGNVRILKAQYGGDARQRCNAQVGFDGYANAKGHYDHAQRRYPVSSHEIFHISIFMRLDFG